MVRRVRGAALALALALPWLSTAALLARVRLDWLTCMEIAAGDGLLPLLLAPGNLLVAALPFLPFALALAVASNAALQGRLMAGAGLVWLWLLWMLHDPGALHHCDRKGGSEQLVALSAAVLSLAVLALSGRLRRQR